MHVPAEGNKAGLAKFNYCVKTANKGFAFVGQKVKACLATEAGSHLGLVAQRCRHQQPCRHCKTSHNMTYDSRDSHAPAGYMVGQPADVVHMLQDKRERHNTISNRHPSMGILQNPRRTCP